MHQSVTYSSQQSISKPLEAYNLIATGNRKIVATHIQIIIRNIESIWVENH